MADSKDETRAAIPVDNLVRAVFPADLEIREASDDSTNGMPTLHGHFAVFNEFTEINSSYEGNFLERIAPGAFSKTIQENRDNMRVLFQHGQDPSIGDKVLGVPTVLEEDELGARYEVPLFDTSYNRDLEPGLRAGAYGASFRFKVMKEDVQRNPGKSDSNPRGLDERTIQEARVMEFGPVTFGAYESATSGVRSLTDDFMPGGRFAPGADAQAERSSVVVEEEAPTSAEEEPTHSPEASRDTPSADERRNSTDDQKQEAVMETSIGEMRARQEEIKRELEQIADENRGSVLSAADQERWDQFDVEWDDLDKRCLAEEKRAFRLEQIASGERPAQRETGTPGDVYVTHRSGKTKTPENVFDTSSYHSVARSQEHMYELIGDGARRALDTFNYPHPQADRASVNAHIENVLRSDSQDKEIALRILNVGSPMYKRAFFKHITGQPMSNEEQRALAVGAVSTGQAAVPIDLDPTLINTSSQSINPMRAISRVFTTTSYIWQGVTSGGVTAHYRAEAGVSQDDSPTLTAPTIQPERVDTFVPFSYEVGQDWGGLESALAVEIQDAKDQLEAVKFAVGTGHASNEPRGVLYGDAGGINVVGSSGATAFAVADIYALESALPARHLPNASWVSTIGMFQKVRQFDTAGGASLWVQLQRENPPELIGYPAYRATNVGTAGAALTSSAKWGVFGDFNKYAIVDRIGMSVRVIPDLFSGNTAGGITYPRGQSGLLAFWRNSAGVLDANAFRIGTIT